MDVLNNFAKAAKKKKGTVIFAEGDEERILKAAVRLVKDGICTVYAVAEEKELIIATAKRKRLDISGIHVLEPSPDHIQPERLERFIERHKEKGVSEKDAHVLAMAPLHFAALFVADGKADSFVAGARSDTSDVIRAALYGPGTAAGTRLISSYFLMVPPPRHLLISDPVLFADCAVNPSPGSFGLRDIAMETIKSFKHLFPKKTARLSFLSFSTKGSAEHLSLKKIKEAVSLVKEETAGDSRVIVDGEMQFDAAVVPAIAKRKAPDSPIAGQANIFIFPDLNAGNICYKMAERFAGFSAIGPILQGTAKPFSDLSRGCSSDDIYYTTAITLLRKE
jgi:phosphate acetyltransferase